MQNEIWRPIPGHDDYFVTNLGRVISYKYGMIRPLAQTRTRAGYAKVGLYGGPGVRRETLVHILVAEAFLGPRPEDHEVRHLDGNPRNSHLFNLAYGTPAENAADKMEHGTHANANLTECSRGHPFDEANTSWRVAGGRTCKACGAERAREYRRQRRAA